MHKAKPQLKSIIRSLQDQGMRITRGRRMLITTMLEQAQPLSAEALRQTCGLAPSDLVTVYRNMDALEKAGVLQRILMENGVQLFEITAPGEHYHHLICRNCHSSERLEACFADQLSALANRHGYTEITHTMEVFGLCAKCRQTKNETS